MAARSFPIPDRGAVDRSNSLRVGRRCFLEVVSFCSSVSEKMLPPRSFLVTIVRVVKNLGKKYFGWKSLNSFAFVILVSKIRGETAFYVVKAIPSGMLEVYPA